MLSLSHGQLSSLSKHMNVRKQGSVLSQHQSGCGLWSHDWKGKSIAPDVKLSDFWAEQMIIDGRESHEGSDNGVYERVEIEAITISATGDDGRFRYAEYGPAVLVMMVDELSSS